MFYFSKGNILFRVRVGTPWTHEEEERQRSPCFPSRSLSTGHGQEKINVSIPRIPCSKSPSSERTKGLSNIYKAALMCFCLLQTASVQIPSRAALMQGSSFGQQSLFLSPNCNKFHRIHIPSGSCHPEGDNRCGFFVLYMHII